MLLPRTWGRSGRDASTSTSIQVPTESPAPPSSPYPVQAQYHERTHFLGTKPESCEPDDLLIHTKKKREKRGVNRNKKHISTRQK